MYVNVYHFSDDLDELARQVSLMGDQWSLAPFALWSCSGTMMRVDFASGPDAKGVVHLHVEMLPKAFVERLEGAEWHWDRHQSRNNPRFTESVFGTGKVSKTTNTKRDMLECLKALDAPKEVVASMRSVKVSRSREWIDDLVPENTETVFSVKTVEKQKHAVATWKTSTDGVEFTVTLDVGPPPDSRSSYVDEGPSYTMTVTFDVTARRTRLLDFLASKGITAMCGNYSVDRY